MSKRKGILYGAPVYIDGETIEATGLVSSLWLDAMFLLQWAILSLLRQPSTGWAVMEHDPKLSYPRALWRWMTSVGGEKP